MAEGPSADPTEQALRDVESTINGILGYQMRVSLAPMDGHQHIQDGSKQYQDALELRSKVYLRLLTRLKDSADKPIKNLKDYAATVTYNVFYEWIVDTKFPLFSTLVCKLRYFLDHWPGYSTWKGYDEEGRDKHPRERVFCGYSHWRGRIPASDQRERLAVLRSDPRAIVPDALTKQVDYMGPKDFNPLLDPIFRYLEGPIRVEHLATAIGPLLGVNLQPEPPPPAPEPRPVEGAIREALERLWAEIARLKPRQRFAYLLNPSGGELDVFPKNEIATIPEIGALLQITDTQFEVLWSELPLDEQNREMTRRLVTYDEKFAMLWNYLPLPDSLIAKLLDATQQQVINLRMVARRIFAKQLHEFV